MTDCTSYIKNLLSQMSTKFNEQTNSELVKNLDYQEDKTLKWKTLINNTYAKKDREKRNKNRNKDGEDSTTVDDDKSSIQPSSSTASTSTATMSKNNTNSTTVSDKKNSKNTSMESTEEEAKSNLIINEKFGNNVKEKKIVIDGDDLHTQKSAAAQQASSTHTNTKKESNDDVEKNINLPQLNTNSQTITTVTSSTSTTDNKLKHDDNTEIMSTAGSGVGGEDDKRNAGGLTTKGKGPSSNGGKVIDKTTSTPRNLRSSKNSSTNSSMNSATLIQRQTSSSMSDDKNKSDEMAIKSDLDEHEVNNEESSNTVETVQLFVVKKGRGRPKLESKITNTSNESKSVNNNKSSTTSTECATDQPENELEMNQKRASRGRVLKTRSILESSEEKKCETPPSAANANATKSEDVEVKKETETDDSSTPIRRSGRSRKLAADEKDEKDNNVIKTVDMDKEKMEVDSNQSEEQIKRTRLNTKKPNEAELVDDNKSDTKSVNDDDVKPRLIMTIRTDKSTAVPKIITTPTTGNGNGNNSNSAPSNASSTADNDQEEKIVKKRGRRPKAASITKSIQVKKSTRLAKDDSDANTSSTPVHSPRKDPALLSAPAYGRMRSQRRIKPTAKILENEELRQGFEVTNCKRLSLSNENLMMETYERSPPAVNRSGNESSNNRSPNASSPESQYATVDIPAQVAEILKNNAKKPCRDPQEFLNEIKSFKIGTNRSPEDNKKLTKSQHRRLIKQKEKHLSMLGLQPRNEYSSSSDESDSEEFNPTTSNRSSAHRPAITLRLRNQHKASNENQKQKNLQLRKREHSEPTQGEKRMKLSSNEQIPELDSSDDDCIVIESRNEATYGNSNGKENSNINLICSCHQKTKYYMRQGQNVSLSVNGKIFCCAIDEIEKRKIGCTNELTESLISLYRPSVKVSYMVLCSSHKKRLASHNCCSGCGLFCTQGTFVICDNKHFFHRNCATKYILNTPYDPNNPNYTGPTLLLKCPHCGIDAPNYDYRVTMRCENLPVFVQHRSNVPKSAKMGNMLRHPQQNPQVQLNSLTLNIDKLIPDNILHILKTAYDRLRFQHPGTDLSKIYQPKDIFQAIYRKDGDERMAEIVASGFNLMTPLKDFHNGTALHLVANFGTLTMAYMIICRANSNDFINMMDKEMRTPIMYSVAGKKHDTLKLLCQSGADVTMKGPDGMTVLHLAAKSGNITATQIILENYKQIATISKLQKFINTTDDGHWTPMVWAAENGHGEIVSYLISLGADCNICDNENNTVLHWASLAGKLESIYPLVANSDLNIQNIHGDTALHIAARQGKAKICMLLMSHGANLNIRNLANESALDVADEKGECAKLLKFNIELRSLGIGGWKSNIGDKLVLSNDISNGREVYPIQIMKNLSLPHTEEIILPDFKYITKNILLQNSIQIDQRISQMRICSCSDNCISENCQCAQISLQNWYNVDGRLIANFNYADPPMLFECNDVCGCNRLLCKNRIVQNGIKLPLIVFECDDKVKGFGVKCLTRIRKGSFVAQYLGEILTDQEADRRTDDSYFFDLGASDHCIDANFYGNVSRFFNHSCSPNIVPVRVYFEHQDLRFPKIAFFASKDIEAGEEIAFDYGEKFWMIKYKYYKCLCKSDKCRYSIETIEKTVNEYNQRHGQVQQ